MSSAGLDVNLGTVNPYRYDQTAIFALNRHQAAVLGVRVDYNGAASGYQAGTIIARNTVTGNYGPYASGGSNGLDTAVGVLAHNVAPASGGTEAAQMIAAGYVYKDKLIGLDAGAETGLKARTIIGADGIAVLHF